MARQLAYGVRNLFSLRTRQSTRRALPLFTKSRRAIIHVPTIKQIGISNELLLYIQ